MAIFRLTIPDPTQKRVFDVPVGVTLIGREPSTNLPLQNPLVSRRHAQLVSDGTLCELVDLGSANGTFVNDERLTPQAPVTLAHGARIRCGPVEMIFEIVAEDTPIPAGDGGQPQAEPQPEQPEPVVELDSGDRLVLDLPVEPSTGIEALPGISEPLGQPPGTAGGGNGSPPPHDDRHPDDGGSASPAALPGLSSHSRQLINFLPGIYQTDFMGRFLAIFESIHMPIAWTIDAFDLFLDPDTSPNGFLPWLGSWYGLTFDDSWSEDQRRLLIREAHAIFARRGTRWALSRVLEIYTGKQPEITDTGESVEPFTFQVRLAIPDTPANRTLITRLIDAHKPAYTTYRLEFVK